MISNKKFFGLTGALAFVLAATSLSHAAVGDTIRVDCGNSSTYVDSKGRTWAADSGFSGGQTYSATSTITGSSDPALHQTERWDSAPFSYTFYVATPGSYRVSLYEASLYSGVCNSGGRVFNVAINGVAVMTDYDMYNEIGECLKEQIKRFVTTVTSNKQIKIDFTLGSASNPKINAIEIVPGSSTSIDAASKVASKFSVASANGALLVQSNVEGAYTMELKDLQGKRIEAKSGFGAGSQSFSSLRSGLYLLTTTAGSEVSTRTVSVLR